MIDALPALTRLPHLGGLEALLAAAIFFAGATAGRFATRLGLGLAQRHLDHCRLRPPRPFLARDPYLCRRCGHRHARPMHLPLAHLFARRCSTCGLTHPPAWLLADLGAGAAAALLLAAPDPGHATIAFAGCLALIAAAAGDAFTQTIPDTTNAAIAGLAVLAIAVFDWPGGWQAALAIALSILPLLILLRLATRSTSRFGLCPADIALIAGCSLWLGLDAALPYAIALPVMAATRKPRRPPRVGRRAQPFAPPFAAGAIPVIVLLALTGAPLGILATH